jgi:hypothetical protein
MKKHLSEVFPVQNGPHEGEALSPLLLKFSLQYTTTKIKEHKEGLGIK